MKGIEVESLIQPARCLPSNPVICKEPISRCSYTWTEAKPPDRSFYNSRALKSADQRFWARHNAPIDTFCDVRSSGRIKRMLLITVRHKNNIKTDGIFSLFLSHRDWCWEQIVCAANFLLLPLLTVECRLHSLLPLLFSVWLWKRGRRRKKGRGKFRLSFFFLSLFLLSCLEITSFYFLLNRMTFKYIQSEVARRRTRLNTEQFQGRKIHRSMFLNYVQMVDRPILKL